MPFVPCGLAQFLSQGRLLIDVCVNEWMNERKTLCPPKAMMCCCSCAKTLFTVSVIFYTNDAFDTQKKSCKFCEVTLGEGTRGAPRKMSRCGEAGEAERAWRFTQQACVVLRALRPCPLSSVATAVAAQ